MHVEVKGGNDHNLRNEMVEYIGLEGTCLRQTVSFEPSCQIQTRGLDCGLAKEKTNTLDNTFRPTYTHTYFDVKFQPLVWVSVLNQPDILQTCKTPQRELVNISTLVLIRP